MLGVIVRKQKIYIGAPTRIISKSISIEFFWLSAVNSKLALMRRCQKCQEKD